MKNLNVLAAFLLALVLVNYYTTVLTFSSFLAAFYSVVFFVANLIINRKNLLNNGK